MADLSPAEELREAARLMQERAEAATEGPWDAMVLGSEGYLVLRSNGTVRDRGRHRVGRFGLKDWDSDKADAEYVASMHPLVALAVADWLDSAAGRYDEIAAGPYGPAGAAFVAGDAGGDTDPAVAVARTYLGGETP